MGRRKEVVEKSCLELESLFKIKALAVQGDVRNFSSAVDVINKVIEKFGKLDILVNGAAGNFLAPAEDLSANAYKTVIEIDLIGTFNMSRAAFEVLKKSKGNIVNISATLHYSTTPWQVHSSSAKAGVDSLTSSLAVEWGDFGIRVNGIAPGPISGTEGMRKLAPPDFEEQLCEIIPLHRMGTPKDIANAAIFLVSDAATYITGQTLVVDGGAWMYHPRLLSREVLQEMESQRQQKSSTPKSKL